MEDTGIESVEVKEPEAIDPIVEFLSREELQPFMFPASSGLIFGEIPASNQGEVDTYKKLNYWAR